MYCISGRASVVPLTVHVGAEAGAPVVADGLHGVRVLGGQRRVARHQVQAGNDGVVHDGHALVRLRPVAAHEEPRGAVVQRLGRGRRRRRRIPRDEVQNKRIRQLYCLSFLQTRNMLL